MYNYRKHSLRNFRRIAAAWRAETDFERVVAAHTGREANKWQHYFPIYGRHFGHLRDCPCSIFEIGVADGGSLAIWREYFGAKAEITGLDINPAVRKCEEAGTTIYIGDQGDRGLLKQIAAERGPFDLVIEDGSHRFDHQILAFETLFEHVKDGGIYVCEDIQTSYLDDEDFPGGVGKPGTFAEYAKGLLDCQHQWFSEEITGEAPDYFARNIYGVHFYPCLAIIDKQPIQEPMQMTVGRLL